jgi:hypothetical protein
MSGQFAAVSTVSLALVGVIALIALIFGLVDILRMPGWAWKRSGKSRVLALVLVIVIPVIGVVIYVFTLREPVASLAAGGKAATLPFDGTGGAAGTRQVADRPTGTASPPVGFGSFGAASPPVGYNPFGAVSPPVGGASPPYGRSSPPVGGGGRQPVYQQPITLTQEFKPSQPQRVVAAPAPAPKPTVPSGWKADPTGRHQFRYWDGFKWTENVADSGVQSTDPVTA